jgi:hypothetical protein
MKKTLPLCLALSFCAVAVEAKTPRKPADFSGNWILNTAQTKKAPAGLESYRMLVTQDAQQLKVQTRLEGDLQSRANVNQSYPQGSQGTGSPNGQPGTVGGDVNVGPGPIGGVGMPPGGVGPMGGPGMPVGGVGPMGGVGMPVGGVGPMGGPGMPVGGVGPMGGIGMPGGSVGGPIGEGTPGGTGGESRQQRHSYRVAANFDIYPPNAIYKLDGSDSITRLGDPTHSRATSQAAWAKNDKELKLSLTGVGSAGKNGDAIDVKEQWRLSKDGQHLLVDRIVHTPAGSTSFHLVFDRQPAGSGQAVATSHKG